MDEEWHILPVGEVWEPDATDGTDNGTDVTDNQPIVSHKELQQVIMDEIEVYENRRM